MDDKTLDTAFHVFDIFNFTKLTLLIFGIVILVMVARAIGNFGGVLNRRIPSKRLLIAQVITVISFLVYIGGGGLLFFRVIDPPKALLLTVSGSLAVALGLSLKDLVASVVAGVILLFDRPFHVGDRISYNGIYGEITSIGLRAVRLITLDDSVVTIPNSRFITDAVSSGNFGALDMLIETKFRLPLHQDIPRARNLLRETAVTSRFVYLKKPIEVVANEVEYGRQIMIELNVKCYVIDVRFEKALQTDLVVRGNLALHRAGLRQAPTKLESDLSQALNLD